MATTTELKPLTADEMCLGAYRSGLFRVNFAKGTIYSKRSRKYVGCLNTKGYVVFALYYGGLRKQVKAHRFLLIAKYGLPTEKMLIDHKSRRKNHNSIKNLRWATNLENAQNRRSYKGENNYSAKINKSIADSIRMEYESVRSYQKLADQYKLSKTLIAKIIRNEIWIQ